VLTAIENMKQRLGKKGQDGTGTLTYQCCISCRILRGGGGDDVVIQGKWEVQI
jgi:hypothetical protein